MVSLVFWDQKAVIHEELSIALESIGVEDLLASGNVISGLDNKSFLLFVVKPGGLTRSVVVEHICKGAKSNGTLSIHLDSKNSAAYSNLCMQEFFESH